MPSHHSEAKGAQPYVHEKVSRLQTPSHIPAPLHRLGKDSSRATRQNRNNLGIEPNTSHQPQSVFQISIKYLKRSQCCCRVGLLIGPVKVYCASSANHQPTGLLVLYSARETSPERSIDREIESSTRLLEAETESMRTYIYIFDKSLSQKKFPCVYSSYNLHPPAISVFSVISFSKKRHTRLVPRYISSSNPSYIPRKPPQPCSSPAPSPPRPSYS